MDRSTFFSRQLILKNFGEIAQNKLFDSKVGIIGMGGLGCPIATYLAAAGVGRLVLVEGDRVEESNLHRQILFSHEDIGKYKCETAGRRLKQAYPFTDIIVINEYVREDNFALLFTEADLIIDGTDDQKSKFLMADASRKHRIPLLYGAVDGFDGQIALFGNDQKSGGVDLRDLFDEVDDSGLIQDCSESGVLGAVAGLIGMEMALEAIKYLTGVGENLVGKMKLIDAFSGDRKIISLGKKKVTSEAITVDSKRLNIIRIEDWEDFKRKTNCILLDVREEHEFGQRNMGGLNIPLGELENRIHEILNDRTYLLICERGLRSRKAANILNNIGLNNVYVLEGGLSDFAVDNKSHRVDDFCD